MDKSIGVLEFGSVVKGIEAADGLLKAAKVQLVSAMTVCPGKYLIIISGDVSSVQTAVDMAASLPSNGILDTFVSGRLHDEVIKALNGSSVPEQLESLGIIEAFSIPAAIQAADTAAKASGVKLLEVRTSRGMGGKSFVLVTGSIGAVSAAVESVKASLTAMQLLDAVVIPRPDPGIWSRIA